MGSSRTKKVWAKEEWRLLEISDSRGLLATTSTKPSTSPTQKYTQDSVNHRTPRRRRACTVRLHKRGYTERGAGRCRGLS